MRRTLFVVIVLVFGALQVVAFLQARSMTHYARGGPRTRAPGTLGPIEQAGVLLTGVRVPRPENESTPGDIGLDFETIRLPRGPESTLETWWIPGTRPAIVLGFPAYATSKKDLLPSAKLLHDLGYGVLLVDYVGVGGSNGSTTTLGFREAKDVAAVLVEARKRWPDHKLVLFGSSMGGAAVLRAIAHEGATPDGLIVEAAFDNLLHTTRNRFVAMGLPPTPFAEVLLFWGGLQNGVDCFDMKPARDARHVACPSLVLQGGADERVGAEGMARLRSGFPSGTTVRVYDGVPHTLLASARPADWRRDVGAFLDRLDVAR